MSPRLFGVHFTQVGVALTRTGMGVIAGTQVVRCLQQLCALEEEDPVVDFITCPSGNLLEVAHCAS